MFMVQQEMSQRKTNTLLFALVQYIHLIKNFSKCFHGQISFRTFSEHLLSVYRSTLEFCIYNLIFNVPMKQKLATSLTDEGF